jgi:uncharacterized lipoprotein YddW (UPF0748 family)
MLRKPGPAWGPEGVHQILDRAKECGWSAVYWRVFDGGKALYPSRLLEPSFKLDAVNYWRDRDANIIAQLERYDYGSYDSFREAIDYGRKIGVEVHAWLSINEDDHGYGWSSRFAREHPQFVWVTRDGRRYRTQMSFAFPQVRAYRLACLREILAYHPDGIFLDWIRTGDVRDNPQTDGGIANYGYEAPNLDHFRARFGVDAHDVPNDDNRWVRVRAEPQTEWMREAHAVIKAMYPRMPISVMTQHPWSYRGSPTDTPYADSLRGLLVDIKTWARLGLMDEVVAAGYYREGGTPEAAWRWLHDEVEGKVPVWLYAWNATDIPTFRRDVELAERLGAPQLLLWESDYILLPPANAELVAAMHSYATPAR